MTNAEKQKVLKAYEIALNDKLNSLSKSDRITLEKYNQVLADQMSRITDESAITIHGLNSELKQVRAEIKK